MRKMLWPLVTRKRFVRELESQGKAYRQNLSLAESGQRLAEQRLAEERLKFTEALDTLSGWRDGDTTVSVDGVDGPPKHLKMRVVRDLHGLRYSLVFDISSTLYDRMRSRWEPRLMQDALETAARRMAAEAVVADFESTRGF